MKEKLFGGCYGDPVSRRESNFLLEDFQPQSQILLMVKCAVLLACMGLDDVQGAQCRREHSGADRQTDHQFTQTDTIGVGQDPDPWLTFYDGHDGCPAVHRGPT